MKASRSSIAARSASKSDAAAVFGGPRRAEHARAGARHRAVDLARAEPRVELVREGRIAREVRLAVVRERAEQHGVGDHAAEQRGFELVGHERVDAARRAAPRERAVVRDRDDLRAPEEAARQLLEIAAGVDADPAARDVELAERRRDAGLQHDDGAHAGDRARERAVDARHGRTVTPLIATSNLFACRSSSSAGQRNSTSSICRPVSCAKRRAT
jgi:hypothetical protein